MMRRKRLPYDPAALHELDLDFKENLEDSPLVAAVNKLPTDDRHILLVWLHCGTVVGTAEHFHVGDEYMRRRIKKIIKEIKDVHRLINDCAHVGGDT